MDTASQHSDPWWLRIPGKESPAPRCADGRDREEVEAAEERARDLAKFAKRMAKERKKKR